MGSPIFDFYERKNSGSDEILIAKLPLDWKPWDGLKYPLTLETDKGVKIFRNYQEHHEFIRNLFKYEIR